MSSFNRPLHLIRAAAVLALTTALAAPAGAGEKPMPGAELCAECGYFVDPSSADGQVKSSYVPLAGYESNATAAATAGAKPAAVAAGPQPHR